MNIKAQGLFNAAKWIETEYGQAALRDVLRACSPTLRDRYTSTLAINWHPMEELVEFLGVADRMLGKNDGKLAEEVGAAGARANMKGAMLRLVFYLAKPEFLMQRITKLWSQFNDEGEMVLLHLDEQSSSIEVKGTFKPQALFCATLSGWAREVATGLGGVNPVVRHTSCRARGQARCVWELRWPIRKDLDPSKPNAINAAAAAYSAAQTKHTGPHRDAHDPPSAPMPSAKFPASTRDLPAAGSGDNHKKK